MPILAGACDGGLYELGGLLTHQAGQLSNQRVLSGFPPNANVQAFLADYLGNLSYALTARNFNPVIAMAADIVIASADNVVPIGVISPDHVVTPAPVVDYLVANA